MWCNNFLIAGQRAGGSRDMWKLQLSVFKNESTAAKSPPSPVLAGYRMSVFVFSVTLQQAKFCCYTVNVSFSYVCGCSFPGNWTQVLSETQWN